MPFVHVHNHTEYSLLDGANRIPEMVSRAGELGMNALAISDHGVMFGVMEFYFECVKQGIKPLIGMEAYVAPGGRHHRAGREVKQNYHLLLLAKNIEGYRNLCKLHSIAALEGFYYSPRIDHDLLRQYGKGLIGTSACLGSEICQELMEGTYDRAQYIAGMYKEIFDEDSFFIELQDHGLPDQARIREPLIKIAGELRLPLVATNDAHYLCKGDAEPHDVLLCIGTGSLRDEPGRMKFESQEFFLKSPDEMEALFRDRPDAIENTQRIAEMCDLELGKQKALMPLPDLPPGSDSRSHLRALAEKGLSDRIPGADDRAWERLHFELGVIETTGFEDYFLLVREFSQFTREQGIFFGVRGSAAGSLVSYTLGITDVDPLEYDLTFERFLNPERVSMPDIDMDFEDARRDEVIRWVMEKYGQDHVAQIVTFGTLGAKAAIKDAGRVMGYAPADTDRICKAIPNVPGITLKKVLEDVNEFKAMVAHEPKVRELVEVARSVEGLARHCGVHAAGVVISRDPLMDHIPLYRGNDGQPVTAFEMGILEKIGLLKMDFLGLSNLTVLAKTIENVTRATGREFRIQDIPLDDKKTFDMLSRGETVGVFQLESGGMRRNIIELKPQSIRELAAMVALYRPGPMDHIPTYIDNKFGRSQPDYLDARMKPVLEETYGVIVYQDQVLKLVQALAGFSLGKADVLRRAMGKKDAKAMASMKVEFLEGTQANGISAEVADAVWTKLEPFAGYAFNKAHAVCYAFLAYQTAYLKANYPVEYMAGLLAVYRSKEDRVTNFIEECRRQRIPVLPPDVNRSMADFMIESMQSNGRGGTKGKSKSVPAIRFGLVAIKGVGDGVVAGILSERESGPFAHLYEFCERTKPHGLNKSVLEALIKAGALDSIDKNRRKLLDFTEAALSFADSQLRSKQAGQESLFGGPDESQDLAAHYPVLPESEGMSRSDSLSGEKEVMGIYISDHPLRGYETAITRAATQRCEAVPELDDGTQVRLAGILAGVRPVTTKRGEKMAHIVVEDLSGQAAGIVFPGPYGKLKEKLDRDQVVVVTGVVMHRERPGSGGEKSVEIRVESIEPVAAAEETVFDADDPCLGRLVVKIPPSTREQLVKVRDLVEQHPGPFRLTLQIEQGNAIYPIELLRTVDGGSEGFRSAMKRLLPGSQLELVRNVSLVDFEDAPTAPEAV
ncbi:MAG TPA: DNA polymerase III subunit alpha [Fimbriimonadaceae bacterium]|nr:DNA polymerase III subunit alpha [Fimbriimonadaceae bacterium]